MLSAGGRGFMRFLPAGALLATDANRRCRDSEAEEALVSALKKAGFVCRVEDNLLFLTPGDELLGSICYDGVPEIDWQSPLHPVQALGARFLKKEKQPLTDAGRQLIIETLRMSWKIQGQLLSGLEAISASAAVMQRQGDTSGMHEAGAILLERCREEIGGQRHEA